MASSVFVTNTMMPTPMGRNPSFVRSRDSSTLVNWASRSFMSSLAPIWPRPPARETAMARGAVAKPPICRDGVVRRGLLCGIHCTGEGNVYWSTDYERTLRPRERFLERHSFACYTAEDFGIETTRCLRRK